jgi:hypothetical protein
MSNRCSVARLLAGVWLALALDSSSALATDAQQSAMAEQLFREGRELMQSGRADAALEKFEASQQLDPSLGTLLNLADCLERLGRTASAWARFTEAEQMARREGDRTRERAGAEHARALEAKLIRLRIVLGPDAKPAEVPIELDGKPLSPALVGTAMPVDPGEHRVLVRAAGKHDWQSSVQLTTPGETTALTIPDLAPAAPEPKPSVVTPAEPAPIPALGPPNQETRPPLLQSSVPPPSPRFRPGVLTIVGGCTSIVALGLGTGFGIAAWRAWSDAKDSGCANGACPTASAQSRAEAAGSRADIATVSFIAAGLAAGGAILSYLLLDRPRSDTPPDARRVVLNASWSKSQMGASLGLTF